MANLPAHSDSGLCRLKCAYATLTPVNRLQWPISSSIEQAQDYIIQQILLDDHLKKYPPSTAYQRSFWRWVLQELEYNNADVDTQVYEFYLEVMSEASNSVIYSSPVTPPSPSYVTHYWKPFSGDLEVRQIQRTTLLESRTLIEQGTTGMRTWPASLFLARFLVSEPDIVNAKVLELGCGTGFLGIVISQLQLLYHSTDLRRDGSSHRTSICLTDANEDVLKRCKENVLLRCNTSSLHPCTGFQMLDWGAAKDESRVNTLETFLGDYDATVIVGADLVYDVSIIPDLVATLRIALSVSEKTQPKRAYIALTMRNEDTMAQFLSIAGDCFYLEEICRSSTCSIPADSFPMGSTEDVRLYMLTARFDKPR